MQGALSLLETTLRNEGKSENTIRAYLSDCQQFFEFCQFDADWMEPKDFERSTREFIQLSRKYIPPSTLNRRVASLRALARILGFPRPLDNYKLPRVGTRPAHPLPNGMLDLKTMLLTATKPQHRALVALCGGVGLRISEARSIRAQDITITQHGPYVRVLGKGAKERHVPIPPLAWTAIEPVWKANDDGGPLIKLSDRGARALITRLGHRAGVSRPGASHDLRMTFGSSVYGASKDIRTTQELLGHASCVTTEGYTLVSENAKRSAVAAGVL